MLKCSLKRYKTQKMCDEAIDASLLALKFVPHWFVTNKMLEKLDVVFSNDDMDLDDKNFSSDGIGIVTIDLNNINLDHIILMKIIL